MTPRVLNRLGLDSRGATIVEFAMILPALCVLLLGIFDLGYRSYASSVLQGALHEAARMSTVGGINQSQIDARVRQRLSNFTSQGTVTITTSSYYEYSHVGTPERITSDTTPIGTYNSGDCYEDANGNAQYDVDRGRAGLGGAEDIVRYQVSIDVPRLFPIHRFLGWTSNDVISGNTILRNQPYAGRSITATVRCS